MKYLLKNEHALVRKINVMYDERLMRAVNGYDTEDNDLELEILFIMNISITKLIEENNIPIEIMDAWISVQLHYIILDIKNKITTNDNFDKIANTLYLDILSK